MSEVIRAEKTEEMGVARMVFEEYETASVSQMESSDELISKIAHERMQASPPKPKSFAPKVALPPLPSASPRSPQQPAPFGKSSAPRTTSPKFAAPEPEPEDTANLEAERARSQAALDAVLESMRKERADTEAKIQQAYEKGLSDGERRREEAEQLLAERYAFGLERLQLLARTLETMARHEALELSLLIARRILQKEIEMNPMLLVEEIKRATTHAMGREEMIIRLNPDDFEAVRRVAPDLSLGFQAIAKVRLLSDEQLERGDCVVDTDVEHINLTLSEQLEAIKRALIEEQP